MWPLVLDLVLRDCASTPAGGRVPRTCDPGFRRHVIELVKVGPSGSWPPGSTWPRPRCTGGVPVESPGPHRPGHPTRGSRPATADVTELAAASRRIQELETELALVKQAGAVRGGGAPRAKYP